MAFICVQTQKPDSSEPEEKEEFAFLLYFLKAGSWYLIPITPTKR